MSKVEERLRQIIEIYETQLKHPFIAFRDVCLHLWIPIISSLIGVVLFGYVDQTQDIYRSLLENLSTNARFGSQIQIALGTFLVFVLSCLVWYSGRLLSYKYSAEERVNPETITDFEVWTQSHHNSSLKALPQHLRCLIQLNLGKKNKLVENLTLLYLPRIIGLLPLTGLLLGLKHIDGSLPSSRTWCILAAIAWGLLFFLFFLRRKISRATKDRSNPGLDNSLFSESAENLLANLALFCFAALTLPMVASLSGKTSWGVILFFILCVFVNALLLWWNPIKKPLWQRANLLNPILLGGVVFIAGLLFLNSPPLFWPYALGSISIAAISLCIVVVILSTVYDWGNEYGVPAISIILVLALLASSFGWNNNHQIRSLDSVDMPSLSPSPDVAQSFQAWFENRPDLQQYRGKDYPVYIISAQGGGIYAAYHAATTLTQLHDAIPSFSDHVFAISGVSGGAVGATVYAALVKSSRNQNIDCPELKLCAQRILGADFLSPLFSLGLFPDLLQRFLPISVNDWDRSRGLEISLEESWKQQIPTGASSASFPLGESFYQFWNPDNSAPALILNTTNVETGERLLISPFTIPKTTTLLDYKLDRPHIPLSTAAGLSARFPVISSAGWFKHRQQNKTYRTRLVDGGYVDNSGLATTRDLIAALELKQSDEEMSAMDKVAAKSIRDDRPKPKLISLAIVGIPPESALTDTAFQGLNEIVSPLLAFWQVYSNRSNKIVEQARYALNRDVIQQNISDLSQYRFRTFYLNAKDLPLGWLLSKTSQRRIDDQNPMYTRCQSIAQGQDAEMMTRPIETANESIKNNACVAKSIFDELKT